VAFRLKKKKRGEVKKTGLFRGRGKKPYVLEGRILGA